MPTAILHEPVESTTMPRERALSEGVESLGDAELLAILLGTGGTGRPVTVLAAELLHEIGGLSPLMQLGPHPLAEVSGVGLAKALRIVAAVELGRRVILRNAPSRRPGVRGAEEVADWGMARIGTLDHEQLWVLSLDGRNMLRHARRVGQGGLHGCSVEARDILRAPLRDAASSLVLLHNHPSGDATPSAEDVELSLVVARAGRVIGLPLVDHVIVAGDTYTSLFDLGLLERPSISGLADSPPSRGPAGIKPSVRLER